MRDIKSYERAMGRLGVSSSLSERIKAAVGDLNDDRPRPVLGGRTAREAFEQDRIGLPERGEFIKEVERTEQKLRDEAITRAQRDSAHRRAVEHVLLDYGLMKEMGDVSRNYGAICRTK